MEKYKDYQNTMNSVIAVESMKVQKLTASEVLRCQRFLDLQKDSIPLIISLLVSGEISYNNPVCNYNYTHIQ